MVKITMKYEDGLTNSMIIDDIISVRSIINKILCDCVAHGIPPPEFDFDEWET